VSVYVFWLVGEGGRSVFVALGRFATDGDAVEWVSDRYGGEPWFAQRIDNSTGKRVLCGAAEEASGMG
tara:strand:+ start:2260 stop:2463 length:204 start_codon:yes stop_codon:yes gene_type:complete